MKTRSAGRFDSFKEEIEVLLNNQQLREMVVETKTSNSGGGGGGGEVTNSKIVKNDHFSLAA